MTFPAQLISYFSSRQGPTTAYSSPGIYTTVVPPGVSLMSAVCIGGGGGGAGSNSSTASGSGGGGGGGVTWGVFSVVPGDVLEITVGSGGTAGGSTGTPGLAGGSSFLKLKSRPGVSIPTPQTILEGRGGSGGSKLTSNNGGAGGLGNIVDSGNSVVYLSGGGNGGNGGSANSGSAGAGGGGGAGGYNGNGGNGGSINPNISPTSAAANSGGGGGGGGVDGSSASTLAYSGGGVGAYGYIGSGQGAGGSNSIGGSVGVGGDGGSFFNDPGALGIYPDLISDTFSIGSTLGIVTTPPILADDFLLLLSGSDKDSGILELPVPAGFTTLSKSINGVYTVSTGSATTETIPSNVSLINSTRDLNFASSYKYVTEEDVASTGGILSGNIVGLATTGIHNLIALRYVPNPSVIQYATESGDPAINALNAVGNVVASPMPDPPSIPNIPEGALGIALGFLSNTLISPNAGDIAGAGSTTIGSLSAGLPPDGTAVMASRLINLVGAGVTVNPNEMRTGTASHARAYTLEIQRQSVGTAVTVVGYAATGTYAQPLVGGGVTIVQPPTSFNLSGTGVTTGDLLIYLATSDSRRGKTDTANSGGKPISNPNLGGGGRAFDLIEQSSSNDGRGGGNLFFRLGYRVFQSGDSTTIDNLITEADPVAAQTAAIAHSVIVLRGANQTKYSANGAFTLNTDFATWDNGADTSYGPPNPPALQTQAANSLILELGLLDNVTISNVTTITPPDNYVGLAAASYGVQNNGAIIMSAARVGIGSTTSEDPSPFIGAGANIWVSQTIIIGGVGGETSGSNLGAGRYGGGGSAIRNNVTGSGIRGGGGAVRLIYGTGRQYPSSNQGNAPETW